VSVQDGDVTLDGPILEREHRRVIRAARRVRGVRNVTRHLDRHLHSDVRGLRSGPTAGKSVSQRRCADFMKANPQSVLEIDSLRQAAELMAAANIGFLPVCDADGKVIGTITDSGHRGARRRAGRRSGRRHGRGSHELGTSWHAARMTSFRSSSSSWRTTRSPAWSSPTSATC
jgi:hypothetical protein